SSNSTADNNNCLVEGNYFNRGATTLAYYINNTYVGSGNNDHIITNNFFDGYTVDGGTNITLANGLSPRTIYHQNKNQTKYEIIQFVSNDIGYVLSGSTSGPVGSIFITLDTTNLNISPASSNVTSRYFKISDIDLSRASPTSFSKAIDLNTALPHGVILLEARAGIWIDPAGSTVLNGAASNEFDLYIIADDTISFASVLDIKASLAVDPTTYVTETYNLNTTGNLAAIKAATQYLIAPLSSYNLKTGAGYRINAIIKLNYEGTSGFLVAYFSPLYVQYRW